MTRRREKHGLLRFVASVLIALLSSNASAGQGLPTAFAWQFSSEERIDLDLKAAASGEGRAMADLGWRYVVRARGPWAPHPNEPLSTGVKQSDAEALRWFRRGADAGSGRAMGHIGWMYLAGRGGLKQDYAQAAQWFRKGAEAGDGRSMGNLGSMYAYGLGIKKDQAEAIRWFRKGAETTYTRIPAAAAPLKPAGAVPYWETWPPRPTGDARSMANLGLAYLAGQGVKQDDAEAVRWLRLAADAGDIAAGYHVAVLTATGSSGVKKEPSVEAIRQMFSVLNTRSIFSGDEFSQGEMTLGDGISPQVQRAIREYGAKFESKHVAAWTTRDTNAAILVGVGVLVLLASLGSPRRQTETYDPSKEPPPLGILDGCMTPLGWAC